MVTASTGSAANTNGLLTMSSDRNLDFHLNFIATRCRICASKCQGTSYVCREYYSDINLCFSIDVVTDQTDVHPGRFCKSCKRTIDNMKQCLADGRRYRPGVQIFEWEKHPRSGKCAVCDLSKGGRKRKASKNRGRPPIAGDSKQMKSCISEVTVSLSQHFKQSINQKATQKLRANSSLGKDRFPSIDAELDLECPVCKDMLDGCVQVDCKGPHTFCADCLTKWLEVSSTCPVCRVHITPDSIQSVPLPFSNILSNQYINCDHAASGCQKIVRLGDLRPHCKICSFRTVHHDHDYCGPGDKQQTSQANDEEESTTVADHMKYITSNITEMSKFQQFEELATAIVKHKLDENKNSGSIVKFKTGGQPLVLMKTTQPRKASDECSKSTLVKRSKILSNMRVEVSGRGRGSICQAAVDIQRMEETDRNQMLSSIGLLPDVKPGAGLLLKADLGITWSKLRKMRRWLRQWNIKIESERKDRERAKSLQFQLKAENLPFTFTVKGTEGKKLQEIRMAPCVAVSSLLETVISRLEDLQRYSYSYTHAHGLLPYRDILVQSQQ
ncbi:uncharacterized protein [Ptychodera flava]|uniref:uncharacterized protein n=1 Tax=Ptychodera flava TaxID=63121 RepID=UPI00396A3560